MENKKLCICVIDDQIQVVLSIRMFLEEEGHRVISCVNSLYAIRLMEQDVPDLVFLDYRMPEIDGGDILDQMRVHPLLESVPIVFITGVENPEKQARGKIFVANEVLRKPCTREKILEVVAKVQSLKDGFIL